MKRVPLVMALCVVAVLVLAGPTVAGPGSTPLCTFALHPDCGNTTGGGSVEFYSVSALNSLKMKLVVTGALPNQGYDLDCYISTLDYAYSSHEMFGTVYTDKYGNGVFSCTICGPYPSYAKDYFFSMNLRFNGGADPGLSQYDAGGSISFTNTVPLDLPLRQICGNTSGGGKAALSAGSAPYSAQMKVVLTGARPNQGYDVIWRYHASPDPTLGTLYTDKKGNATIIYPLSWAAVGDYLFGIDLRLNGGPDDGLAQYATDPLIITVN